MSVPASGEHTVELPIVEYGPGRQSADEIILVFDELLQSDSPLIKESTPRITPRPLPGPLPRPAPWRPPTEDVSPFGGRGTPDYGTARRSSPGAASPGAAEFVVPPAAAIRARVTLRAESPPEEGREVPVPPAASAVGRHFSAELSDPSGWVSDGGFVGTSPAPQAGYAGISAVDAALAHNGGPSVGCCVAPLAPDCRPLRGRENGTRRQVTGVDSATCVPAGEPTWNMRGPLPWECFAQGEYVGPQRYRHMDKYRLRVDDQLDMIFRLTRERSSRPYELNVGDTVRVESAVDEKIDRDVEVQPDGTVTLRLLGAVMAAGRTTEELRADLEHRYQRYLNEPSITVYPVKVNARLEDLRNTVDSRQGRGGQSLQVRVAPDGTVQLPGLGSVTAHGLTLEELKLEIDARYAQLVSGIEVTPILMERAPRFIYVVGEVTEPGRYELTAPTTVIQSIALARGWVNGANLRQIVIFRRSDDWRLLATKIDVQGALYGRRPAPSDEIWLRDSDVVIVPKNPIKVADDAIELLFTRGVYGAAPFLGDAFLFTDASRLF